MSANPDPVPTDDPRAISRVCPVCQGRGWTVVALGPNGEQWTTRDCSLCRSTGEINRARAIQLGLAAEAEG